MVERSIIVRRANSTDVHAMAEVDRQSWPRQLATTVEQYASRIDTFAEGQLLAEMDQRVVAVASAQKITDSFLHKEGHSYAQITDQGHCMRSHDPNGEIYQLINVGVFPNYRGHHLGRRLIDKQIDLAKKIGNSPKSVGTSHIRRILGFTRPASLHLHPDLTIEDYLLRRNTDGTCIDPVIAFHLNAGAQLVNIVRNFRPEDTQARGFGVLIEYPVDGQTATANGNH